MYHMVINMQRYVKRITYKSVDTNIYNLRSDVVHAENTILCTQNISKTIKIYQTL